MEGPSLKNGDDVCPVCLVGKGEQPKESWTTIGCNHSFHTACIAQWQQVSHQCPICREDFDCAYEGNFLGVKKIRKCSQSWWGLKVKPLLGSTLLKHVKYWFLNQSRDRVEVRKDGIWVTHLTKPNVEFEESLLLESPKPRGGGDITNMKMVCAVGKKVYFMFTGIGRDKGKILCHKMKLTSKAQANECIQQVGRICNKLAAERNRPSSPMVQMEYAVLEDVVA